MLKAPIGTDEKERLSTLLRYQVLDTLEEEVFDDITKLASSICGTPIALISLVDQDRQWFKSKQGLEAKETPRDISFCGHAIQQREIFEIRDSSQDSRFADNPLATGAPHVRFYAGAPLVSDNGKAIGTLCVIDHEPKSLDPHQRESLQTLARHTIRILEMRLKERESKNSHEHLQKLTESMAEGVVLQNRLGAIIEFNLAALEILGLTADQITGKTSMDPKWRAIHEDGSDFIGSDHPAMVTLQIGKNQKNVIMGVHRPSGEMRWISINSIGLDLDEQSRPTLVMTTFSDITRIKEQEARINQTSKMSALGEMAGGLAHEINNPLAIISGYANIITAHLNKNPSEINFATVREKLSLIDQTVFRISKIIKGLRSFASSSSKDPKEKITFSQILDDTLVLCQERFKNGQVSLSIESGEKPTIQVRPGEISQVLLNLLNNAYDAIQNQSEKWVKVNSYVRDGYFVFTVTDSGTSIPDYIRKKIMQPFFTTKEVGKGMGLGLSISKGIIEGHGGKFYLDSQSTQTCFVVEIPLNE